MRHLILIVLALSPGCMDYTLADTPHCVAMTLDGTDYAVCDDLVSYEEAQRECSDLGATLALEPGTRVHSEAQSDAAYSTGEPVWVQWPPEYACPMLDELGATGPSDCDEPRPYLCEFGGGQ